MSRLAVALLLCALPKMASADETAALIAHVEQLIVGMRPAGELRVDPRLERSLQLIAARLPASGPPPNELVEAALWQNSIVEPVPQLITVTTEDALAGRPLGDTALDDELKQELPAVLAAGHFRFVAAAAARVGGGARVVIALQESFVQLSGVVRELPLGGTLHLRGKLRAPYTHVESFATLPTGQVARLPIAGDASRFAIDFRCTAQGRQQIELTGEERFGPQVVANFPLYCGEQAPIALPAVSSDAPAKSVDDAEATLFALLAADRRAAGVGPLVVDARLTQVARAHSQDMLAHGFVGHVSPTTGSAADRLHAANIGFGVVAENVARAYAPAEAERGLMDSPGHRANLLNTQVSRVGIGVALAPLSSSPAGASDGARELYVTQLFVQPAAPPSVITAAAVQKGEDEQRRRHNLPRLGDDGDLDHLAQRAAQALAGGGDEASAGRLIDAALPGLASRYAQIRTLQIVVDTDSASPSTVVGDGIADVEASALGVGVARGLRQGHGCWFVVLLVATPQTR